MKRRQLLFGAASVSIAKPLAPRPAAPNEARVIAKEATIYGFPLVDALPIHPRKH